MNRTKAILMAAALLALVAVLVGRSGGHAVEPGLAPATGAVAVTATPAHRYLLIGGTREVYLDISLAALAGRPARQLPINLALVIDRSGSMAGEKLEHARQAARTVVKRLRDGDRIAIVTYGSDVTLLAASTLIDASSRVTLLAAIDDIVDRGGTFLSGGLESGREQVQRHARQGFVNRVLLISDGQANEGVTGVGELASLARSAAEQGVHVSTMGVGLDFNEDLMTAMAENGSGHYYFIQDSASLAAIFDKELSTMLSTVGREASLKLELQPGVELVEVYGYAFHQKGAEVRVDLPDLYSGQSRKLICKLRVDAQREGKLALATVELGYLEAGSRSPVAERSRVSVELTSDAEKFQKGQDHAALARAEQAAAAKKLTEAMDAYGRGDLARSQAVLRAQIDATVQANRRLKNKDLEALVGSMRKRLSGTAAAPPASEAGRALIKAGKYEAYEIAK